VDEMGRPYKPYEEEMQVCWDFVGKPEGKKLLGRSRSRLEDNIEWILEK
jgi:hypothetical protein